MKIKLIGFTFLGGAIGSIARYALTLDFEPLVWLWIVNLGGTFLLGYVQVHKAFKSSESQSFWATGFAGGFTTMSGLVVFEASQVGNSFLNLALQISIGVVLYWLGRLFGGDRTWSKS